MKSKTDRAYWDGLWTRGAMPRPVDPTAGGLRNHLRQVFHRFFVSSLGPRGNTPRTLLEVGCAQSIWLPYFSKYLGFDVTGIDYSETGCHMARQALADQDATGTIVCADVFEANEVAEGAFDAVFTNGFVEHFHDVGGVVKVLARYLKPRGLVVTIVPNFAGSLGPMQKLFNRRVYDTHVVLDRDALATAHEAAGLEVMQCFYFGPMNFGVLNLAADGESGLVIFVKRLVFLSLIAVSGAFWAGEKILGPMGPSPRWSPYIACVARKPV